MVLYKLSASKSAKLLTASLIDKFKHVTHTSFSLHSFDTHHQPIKLHQFNHPSKLNLWTMITDSIFGGSSTCRLGYTEKHTFVFSGELCGPLTAQSINKSHQQAQIQQQIQLPQQETQQTSYSGVVLSSFCRLWYIYLGFHKDLSDFSGLSITFRILNNDNSENTLMNDSFAAVLSSEKKEEGDVGEIVGEKEKGKAVVVRNAELKDFQCQIQHNDFMDDLFFYCPFHFNSEKSVVRDEETGDEWITIRLPFNRFSLNKMGTELGVSGDWVRGETISDDDFLKFAKNEAVPVQDIVSIGVGVTSSQRARFSIELKHVEAY